jgi:predicted SAM-dependent methyltransferase
MMRLHIGASREQLAHKKLAPLLSSEWIHLGDPELIGSSNGQAIDRARHQQIGDTTYRPFYYQAGNRLPFDDGAFSFIFSEHFFEHLFLDEAGGLLKECFRVIAPGGCLRVVVPDADLRTYKPIEPAGFSTGDARWHHPDKHKSRWSIYSLSYVLSEIGFQVRGVVYCDKLGSYHCRLPCNDPTFYAGCADASFIHDISYILRFEHSLVVDAVKRG